MVDSTPDAPRQFELASRGRLAQVEALADRFFREVLGYEYADCLVTDESDLHDFAAVTEDADVEVASMFDRLESHYLIDGQEAASTRIVDLLEFLRERGVAT